MIHRQRGLLAIRSIDSLRGPQLLEVNGAAPCSQVSPVASTCDPFGLHADGVFARRHLLLQGVLPWPESVGTHLPAVNTHVGDMSEQWVGSAVIQTFDGVR